MYLCRGSCSLWIRRCLKLEVVFLCEQQQLFQASFHKRAGIQISKQPEAANLPSWLVLMKIVSSYSIFTGLLHVYIKVCFSCCCVWYLMLHKHYTGSCFNFSNLIKFVLDKQGNFCFSACEQLHSFPNETLIQQHEWNRLTTLNVAAVYSTLLVALGLTFKKYKIKHIITPKHTRTRRSNTNKHIWHTHLLQANTHTHTKTQKFSLFQSFKLLLLSLCPTTTSLTVHPFHFGPRCLWEWKAPQSQFET